MEAGTATPIRKQLSLNVGGATVDTAQIGSVTFAAQIKELAKEFSKGDDVGIRLVARVVGVDVEDKYDAHGNVSETIRKHDLRIDELEVLDVNAKAYTLAADAAAEGDPAD